MQDIHLEPLNKDEMILTWSFFTSDHHYDSTDSYDGYGYYHQPEPQTYYETFIVNTVSYFEAHLTNLIIIKVNGTLSELLPVSVKK